MGYNGIGRLTGDEPGGLGNLNFDVGWSRLFGHGMGVDIAWLLPAAVICLGAIVVLTRRAARTDPVRAAAFIWGGWLLVTAAVFSFMSGIVHPYYTVALAPAIAASGGHRRNTPVAEPFQAARCNRIVGHRSGQLRPGVRAVGSDRRLAALAQAASSPSGEWGRRRCYWWSAG